MTSRRTAGHKSRFRAPRAAAGAALALAVGVACVAPAPPDGAAAPVSLYVANALDGTVRRLDSVRGRAMGPPFAAGPKPSKLVAGPGGRLLVLSTSLGQAALTRIVPDTQGGTTQPVPLEPAARQALLAGNGGRHAAVAYHVPAAGTAIGALECRVAFVDLLTGAVERGHNVCGPGEQIVGLALAEDTATVTAYLALWRPPAPGVGPGASGAGRVMEVDVASDAVVASITVAGAASHLTLAPAPGGVGRRLYFVAAQSLGEDEAGPAGAQGRPGYWRLRGVNPVTFGGESDLPLTDLPGPLAFAPDGNSAYLIGSTSVHLLALDLGSGRERPLAAVPALSLDLTVTADRVYVPDTGGNTVWAIDRRDGRLAQMLPVGRHPVSLVLGGPM